LQEAPAGQRGRRAHDDAPPLRTAARRIALRMRG
jgi:hypothetical protein